VKGVGISFINPLLNLDILCKRGC